MAGVSPGFKVMVLSDGSVTRHLRLITGTDIQADCLEMREVSGATDDLPAAADSLRPPLIQRQVLLRAARRAGAEGGRSPPLVYAASWWNAEDAGHYLSRRERPIWASLQDTELRRDIQEVYLGTSKALARSFGAPGPFWGRQYTFWKGGAPLTVIYEVFSPRLVNLLEQANF